MRPSTGGITKKWPREACDRLRELWLAGKTAPECLADPRISKTGTTRNGVIGKVHRMGLDSHKRTGPKPKPRERLLDPARAARRERANGVTIKRPGSPPVAAPSKQPAPAPPPSRPVHFMKLVEGMCRHPYGEPAEMLYCGSATGENKLPYCPHHRAQNWNGIPKAKADRDGARLESKSSRER